MRRGARMADKGFDSAKTDCIVADLQAAQEIKCRQPAAVEFEREKRAGIVGLGVPDADLFVIGKQRWVENAFDPPMRRDLLGDSLRILTLAIHTQPDRGQP